MFLKLIPTQLLASVKLINIGLIIENFFNTIFETTLINIITYISIHKQFLISINIFLLLYLNCGYKMT